MQLFAILTITGLALLAPTVARAQNQALLSESEQRSLRDKLSKMVEAKEEYLASTGRAREKSARQYDNAKEDFFEEWEKRVKQKGNLLASVPDLEVIFADVFVYPRNRPLTIRKMDADRANDIPAHGLAVPKDYRHTEPWRTVLLVPGKAEGGQWADGLDYFAATWDKAAALEDTVFHVPFVDDTLDLDPVPDLLTVEGETNEKLRIREVLLTLGETNRNYNLDRRRLFLDAGRGACAFAVRLATYFPDRFAGLVLRHPTAVDEVRLGSLTGLPVLLLSSAGTADACEQLKKRFEALGDTPCTILATTDAYPHAAAAPQIQEWMSGQQRVVNRAKVVLEPNHEQFKKAYWVAIEAMDPLHTAPLEKRPRIAVQADRTTNRITIDATGVESVFLTLNDTLIDLDKDFTIVANGKVIPDEQRSRDFHKMLDYVIQRYDADFLFPVQFRVTLPEPESEGGGTGTDGQSGGR